MFWCPSPLTVLLNRRLQLMRWSPVLRIFMCAIQDLFMTASLNVWVWKTTVTWCAYVYNTSCVSHKHQEWPLSNKMQCELKNFARNRVSSLGVIKHTNPLSKHTCLRFLLYTKCNFWNIVWIVLKPQDIRSFKNESLPQNIASLLFIATLQTTSSSTIKI